jgi:hypothetical protein
MRLIHLLSQKREVDFCYFFEKKNGDRRAYGVDTEASYRGLYFGFSRFCSNDFKRGMWFGSVRLARGGKQNASRVSVARNRKAKISINKSRECWRI